MTIFTHPPIHALIGSELFFDILKVKQVRLTDANCTLQNNGFGCLVIGLLPQIKIQSYNYLLTENCLVDTLKRFSEVESLLGDNIDSIKSDEEILFEKYFRSTYKLDQIGGFTVTNKRKC